jgi:hypothetical protein
MASLNELELAALDLLIAYKKSGQAPQAFLNANIAVNNLGDVAAAAGAVAAVAAVVAAAPVAVQGGQAIPQTQGGPGISLDELLEIRTNALRSGQ